MKLFRPISLTMGLVLVLFVVASCASKPNVPTEVSDAARNIWQYYSWSESNFGVWRGGGWHLETGNEQQTFEITQAQKGKLPQDLEIAMSLSTRGYLSEVWCLSFRPPLYFGIGADSGNDVSMENMLFFQGNDKDWMELGQVWDERWVRFLYDPGVYKTSTNFYMGTTKKMFEMMGCSNWQEAEEAAP